jgi:hypothetical protein
MVKNFFNNLLSSIVTFFTGKRVKGQPVDYPTLGQVRTQSTCMPDDNLDFNAWTSNLERIKTGK